MQSLGNCRFDVFILKSHSYCNVFSFVCILSYICHSKISSQVQIISIVMVVEEVYLNIIAHAFMHISFSSPRNKLAKEGLEFLPIHRLVFLI